MWIEAHAHAHTMHVDSRETNSPEGARFLDTTICFLCFCLNCILASNELTYYLVFMVPPCRVHMMIHCLLLAAPCKDDWTRHVKHFIEKKANQPDKKPVTQTASQSSNQVGFVGYCWNGCHVSHATQSKVWSFSNSAFTVNIRNVCKAATPKPTWWSSSFCEEPPIWMLKL